MLVWVWCDYWRRSQTWFQSPSLNYVASRRGYRILDKKGHGETIVDENLQNAANTQHNSANRTDYEPQEYSAPDGMHRC